MQLCPYCMEQSRSGRYLFTTPLRKALRLSVTTNCYPQPSRVAGLHIFVYHHLFFILRCMGQYKRTHYLLPKLPCMSMGQMPSVIRCTESPYHLSGIGQIEPEAQKIHAFRTTASPAKSVSQLEYGCKYGFASVMVQGEQNT